MSTPVVTAKKPRGRPAIPRAEKRVGYMIYIKQAAMDAIENEATIRGARVQELVRNCVELWAAGLINEQSAAKPDGEQKDTPPESEGEVTI